jgi:hypothetical protein
MRRLDGGAAQTLQAYAAARLLRSIDPALLERLPEDPYAHTCVTDLC